MSKTRQEVKRDYAVAQIEAAKKKGINNPVVVMPVFIEESGIWMATDEVAITGNNPEWCAVNVVSISSLHQNGFERELYLSALIRRRLAGTDAKYKPGQLLTGKIYTVESLVPSNPADITAGLKYITSSLREANMPCTLNDQPIYQNHYYTDNLDEQDVVIAHTNDAALQAEILRLRGTGTKANSEGIRKAARLAELQGKPKAQLTKAEKLELVELEA